MSGKLIPIRYIRQREIIEQEITLHLKTLSIWDSEHETMQSAIDRLHQQ